eukprot:CAMPEP_0115069906 /NCGR_PEP_ID=MMETSP0227-20121206/12816_1 /TAXON_ID=89957 /ORGANISM="Polarella glacialis, Strain CCMP 1383" /LENGTH=291 /DNA_ID=CAMNT_0002456357 /DNA_START=405 /DNA_END=1280 /DNA_ORIENTATION=+
MATEPQTANRPSIQLEPPQARATHLAEEALCLALADAELREEQAPSMTPRLAVTDGVHEAYELNEPVEYYSRTHHTWAPGNINSPGLFDSAGLPSYQVLLRGNRQVRNAVDLHHLRRHFQDGESVTILCDLDLQFHVAVIEAQENTSHWLGHQVRILQVTTGDPVRHRVPSERLRRRFPAGHHVEVYQGGSQGWVAARIAATTKEPWRQAVDAPASPQVISRRSDEELSPELSHETMVGVHLLREVSADDEEASNSPLEVPLSRIRVISRENFLEGRLATFRNDSCIISRM